MKSIRVRPRRWPLGMVAVLLVFAVFLLGRLTAKELAPDGPDQAYEQLALLTQVIELIRQDYVDAEKIDYKSLIRGALHGMLQSLDPYSQYMEPQNYEEMKDETRGEYGGIGVVIGLRDGVLSIIAPMEDTPGFEAGLLAGDRIIEIEGESTAGITLQEAVERLRGEPGTKVRIKVSSDSRDVREVELVRAVIKIESVKDARILKDGVGYVRVTQFNHPTAGSLEEQIEALLEKEMEALVLDLRHNPGGLLDSAIAVSSLFLKQGSLVVETKGRPRSQSRSYAARGRRAFTSIPMVVLVDGASASASEIVAGALRDHKRAILVGEKTFGKGSVQTVLPLEDGSAVRLTTAKYYTPSKQVIHEHGIEPDVRVPMSPEKWRDVAVKRAERGKTEGEQDETWLLEEDAQLRRAVDVLTGVRVFRTRTKPRNEL